MQAQMRFQVPFQCRCDREGNVRSDSVTIKIEPASANGNPVPSVGKYDVLGRCGL